MGLARHCTNSNSSKKRLRPSSGSLYTFFGLKHNPFYSPKKKKKKRNSNTFKLQRKCSRNRLRKGTNTLNSSEQKERSLRGRGIVGFLGFLVRRHGFSLKPLNNHKLYTNTMRGPPLRILLKGNNFHPINPVLEANLESKRRKNEYFGGCFRPLLFSSKLPALESGEKGELCQSSTK